MGNFTDREKQVLMPLVADTVNYGFSEPEALAYIKGRLGREISVQTYYRRKKEVDFGEYARECMSYYSKVGFFIVHKNIIDVIERIQKDILRDYFIENSKPHNEKNMELIMKLRSELRENSKLMQEVSLGTPIIAQIKAKIEHAELLQERQ